MLNKPRFPRSRAEFDSQLKLAFKAGCDWGYGVDVAADPAAQEEAGARHWVGEITLEEALDLKQKIIDENRPQYE